MTNLNTLKPVSWITTGKKFLQIAQLYRVLFKGVVDVGGSRVWICNRKDGKCLDYTGIYLCSLIGMFAANSPLLTGFGFTEERFVVEATTTVRIMCIFTSET
jgi:hypothetical protein